MDVYEAPLVVQRLKHVCRVVVNQYVRRSDISKLGLPNELVKYLMYEDIKEHVHNSSPPASTNGNHHLKATTSPTSIHSLTTCHWTNATTLVNDQIFLFFLLSSYPVQSETFSAKLKVQQKEQASSHLLLLSLTVIC